MSVRRRLRALVAILATAVLATVFSMSTAHAALGDDDGDGPYRVLGHNCEGAPNNHSGRKCITVFAGTKHGNINHYVITAENDARVKYTRGYVVDFYGDIGSVVAQDYGEDDPTRDGFWRVKDTPGVAGKAKAACAKWSPTYGYDKNGPRDVCVHFPRTS